MRRIAYALGLTLAATTMVVAAQVPRITRIEFGPVPESRGGGVAITLLGNGKCSYLLDYGDETSERRTADLPDTVTHRYPTDGDFLVVATPEPPCEGVARAKLDIRPIEKGIWKVTVVPGPSTDSLEMIATLDGRGLCPVTVDFGDGNIEKIEASLPATINHTYEKAGSYELRATASGPCRGDVHVKVDIH